MCLASLPVAPCQWCSSIAVNFKPKDRGHSCPRQNKGSRAFLPAAEEAPITNDRWYALVKPNSHHDISL